MTRVAILASGNGSNAQALIDHFKNDDEIEIALIGSNRNSAAVLEKASFMENPSVTLVTIFAATAPLTISSPTPVQLTPQFLFT